ncbi:uncharacterized protein [Temnothorax longispinosus]
MVLPLYTIQRTISSVFPENFTSLSKHIGNRQYAIFLPNRTFKNTLIIIFRSMSCDARGRCHFCCKKHTVSVFGSDKETYTLLQKLNFRLVVLNTICSPCIIKLEDNFKRNFPDIRSPFEKTTTTGSTTHRNNDDLEIMEKSRVNENFQAGKATETDVEPERSVDSIDTENKAGINNSQVRKNTENIRKKQLTCEFCQKEFNHAGDLNKHRRKHTGEQPYACNMCERKFKTSSNLVRHQQIHLGIKPFCCQICGRTFTRKIKLSAHLMAKHHEALKSNRSMI